jgi:hypothetical protein
MWLKPAALTSAPISATAGRPAKSQMCATGVVHAKAALEGLLSRLCAYAITAPDDKARKEVMAKASQYVSAAV